MKRIINNIVYDPQEAQRVANANTETGLKILYKTNDGEYFLYRHEMNNIEAQISPLTRGAAYGFLKLYRGHFSQRAFKSILIQYFSE